MILHLVRPLFPRIECMNNLALKSDLRPSYGQINKVVFCDLRRRMAPRTRTTIGQFGVIIVIKSKIRKNFSMIIDILFLLKHRLSSRYGSCVTLLPIGRHHARSTVAGFNGITSRQAFRRVLAEHDPGEAWRSRNWATALPAREVTGTSACIKVNALAN